MIKHSQTSKPKMSKEFVQSLKNIPQIPQRSKQVPAPPSNSQFPSPIITMNKNKKNEQIRQFPIENICLEKGQKTIKPVVKKDQSLKERKQNTNDRDYDKVYPEHLKPTRKDQSSLVKKARDQRLSRSLIDMSIYDLLDQTTNKKPKHHPGNQNISNDDLCKKQKQKATSKINSKVQNENKPLVKSKVPIKDNGIKVINNINKNYQKERNHKDAKRPQKRGIQEDIFYYQRGHHYEDQYHSRNQYPQSHNFNSNQNYRDYRNHKDIYSNLYDGYNNYRDDTIYGGRLKSMRGYGQLTGLVGYGGYEERSSSFGYGYGNLMRYY